MRGNLRESVEASQEQEKGHKAKLPMQCKTPQGVKQVPRGDFKLAEMHSTPNGRGKYEIKKTMNAYLPESSSFSTYEIAKEGNRINGQCHFCQH